MPRKTERVTHYGSRNTCCSTLVLGPKMTPHLPDVTCRVCVYHLWKGRQVADDDPRITSNMRAHARGEFVTRHGKRVYR